MCALRVYGGVCEWGQCVAYGCDDECLCDVRCGEGSQTPSALSTWRKRQNSPWMDAFVNLKSQGRTGNPPVELLPGLLCGSNMISLRDLHQFINASSHTARD
ncbi:Hypothetical protein NTJ_09225 [Nesidiocoris tenuis]|uniref:Uncharacterized protein n=1 Tax=Nesidiocoris tenuis TaxID=355587 RepID=A0ABN7AWS7_9HEMI|nr:Hypothetical protein NTJ_09225 [Nesidiocoris tenuis]